ncbi:hypothetical protein RSAG8_12253, partial [Rhizoctonia solani AG-8 WAC10335]
MNPDVRFPNEFGYSSASSYSLDLSFNATYATYQRGIEVKYTMQIYACCTGEVDLLDQASPKLNQPDILYPLHILKRKLRLSPTISFVNKRTSAMTMYVLDILQLSTVLINRHLYR